MKTIIIGYVQYRNRTFYRISSNSSVRDVLMTSPDRDYQSLQTELEKFSLGQEVELKVDINIPSDKRAALEELVVMHNAVIKK